MTKLKISKNETQKSTFFLQPAKLCPVQMFECYTSKLHKDQQWFWQCPKRGRLHYNDKIWYDKIRVGHEPIEDFLSRLSAEAQLSKWYTNHSIRSTVMGILSELYEGGTSLASVVTKVRAP